MHMCQGVDICTYVTWVYILNFRPIFLVFFIWQQSLFFSHIFAQMSHVLVTESLNFKPIYICVMVIYISYCDVMTCIFNLVAIFLLFIDIHVKSAQILWTYIISSMQHTNITKTCQSYLIVTDWVKIALGDYPVITDHIGFYFFTVNESKSINLKENKCPQDLCWFGPHQAHINETDANKNTDMAPNLNRSMKCEHIGKLDAIFNFIHKYGYEEYDKKDDSLTWNSTLQCKFDCIQSAISRSMMLC